MQNIHFTLYYSDKGIEGPEEGRHGLNPTTTKDDREEAP